MHQAIQRFLLFTLLVLAVFRLAAFLPVLKSSPGATVPPSHVTLVKHSPAVAAPQFDIAHGFYQTDQTVTLTSDTPGAVIRYTLDGSMPDARNGQAYNGPIVIAKTAVLRAVAVGAGGISSRESTRTYILPNTDIGAPRMRSGRMKFGASNPRIQTALIHFPSLSLVTQGAIDKLKPTPASIEWLDPETKGEFQESCGMTTYGGDFTNFAKKNFRLSFRPEFGAAKLSFPLFAGYEHGLAAVEEFDQLDLRSGSHDMVQRGFYMSNLFADDSLLEMGHLNPHGRFVHLYLNGVYWGVFHLRERFNAAMHRRYLGGSKTNYESINGNLNVGGWADPGVPYDGDGRAWAKVRSLRRNYRAVEKWLDVPQYIDFMILWMFGSCEDEYRCVGPTVPGSGFKFYLNDADGFFQSPAHPWYHEPSRRTAHGRSGGRSPGDGPGSLFSTLFNQGDSDYRMLLADRIYQACFNSGPLTPAQTAARLKTRCNELEPAFIAESTRWGYRSPADWASVRDDVLDHWLPQRTARLLAELRAAGFYPRLDAPTLNQQGGLVTSGFQVRFTGPANSTFLYTLDGTDPRLPGGAVAPSALSGSVPLVILRNTVVKARTQAGGSWSALNEAFFQCGPTALDPSDVLGLQREIIIPEGHRVRFLELSNSLRRAVNLRGARLTGGLKFTFSEYRDTLLGPGQKLVLVQDLFRFRQHSASNIPVAGIYSGKSESDNPILLSTKF